MRRHIIDENVLLEKNPWSFIDEVGERLSRIGLFLKTGGNT